MQMILVIKLDSIYVVQRVSPPLLSAVLQQMGVTGGESVCITNLILSGRHHSHTLTHSRPNEILPLCPCPSSSICVCVWILTSFTQTDTTLSLHNFMCFGEVFPTRLDLGVLWTFFFFGHQGCCIPYLF